VTLLLRLLGTLLLLLAGMGGGFAAAARAENSRRQLHSFARLLTYLAELLDTQALTGPELLRRAAQDPAFAVFLSRTGGEPVRADTACLYAGRTAAGGAVEPFRRRGGSAPDGLCRAAPPGFAL
jgi:hypothetical protein